LSVESLKTFNWVVRHLTIIADDAFGNTSTPILLLLLGLKTLTDVLMHRIEHAAWRKKQAMCA